MRLKTQAYRAHDPKWSFRPLSGDGAAIHGGRFNPKGVPALYLGLTPMAAIKEASQGLAFKIEPLVLCGYAIDCEDVVDLCDETQVEALAIHPPNLACGWMLMASEGQRPPTWTLASRLMAEGRAGAIVPSFAPGATLDDRNLVLWRWGPTLPHKVTVHDPSGRLPKNQLSWR
ncbi:RES family NAD+ phosphorylase [soil metagenome]